ncbi:hypothetical protein TcasGA2_TC012485 [Tribolium castaneum]|uniref:Uncharacterized protein n=1 Tax=Tribolium castaneum TaxID=7070 RepID=D6X2Q4_TRICA|nr:hypothetical protein TcasGA2_TC012485 [Tribolium castaneum]
MEAFRYSLLGKSKRHLCLRPDIGYKAHKVKVHKGSILVEVLDFKEKNEKGLEYRQESYEVEVEGDMIVKHFQCILAGSYKTGHDYTLYIQHLDHKFQDKDLYIYC